ncbi:hypothetical protein FXO38_15209 [Capsicum annuum]|nr:hypothetical protein FXO38_15209 [Capsicum annuum]KAF3664606.1 hypothetical protein FXO37_11419 [Capsicum annuum]
MAGELSVGKPPHHHQRPTPLHLSTPLAPSFTLPPSISLSNPRQNQQSSTTTSSAAACGNERQSNHQLAVGEQTSPATITFSGSLQLFFWLVKQPNPSPPAEHSVAASLSPHHFFVLPPFLSSSADQIF